MTEYKIPRAANPLAKYWQQPPRDRVLVDDGLAMMAQRDFDTLQDCTGQRPAPPVEGIMWRVRFRGVWWLMWYERSLLTEGSVETNWRQIVVLE